MKQATAITDVEYIIMTKCINSIRKLYFATYPGKGIIKVIFCVTFDPTKSGVQESWVIEKFNPNKLYFIEYNVPFNYIGPLQLFKMLYPYRTLIDHFTKGYDEKGRNKELRKLVGGGVFLYDYEEPTVEDIEDESNAAEVEVQSGVGIGMDGDFEKSIKNITSMSQIEIELFFKDYPKDLYYNIIEKVLYIKMNKKVKGSELEFLFTNISDEQFKIFHYGLFSGYVIYKMLYVLLGRQGVSIPMPGKSKEIEYNIAKYQTQQKDKEQLFKQAAKVPYGSTKYGDILK